MKPFSHFRSYGMEPARGPSLEKKKAGQQLHAELDSDDCFS